MDTALDQNQTKLAILVLAVPLQMLPDLHGLFDEHVEVLGNLGSQSVGLEDADNLLSRDGTDLGNAIGITEDNTNLGGSQTLFGQTADLVLHVGRVGLEPRGGSALVGAGTLGDTLSGSMKTTHVDVLVGVTVGDKR